MALASRGPKVRGGGEPCMVHTMTFGDGRVGMRGGWGWGLLIMMELLCLFLSVANSLSFLIIIIIIVSLGELRFLKYLLNDNFSHVRILLARKNNLFSVQQKKESSVNCSQNCPL